VLWVRARALREALPARLLASRGSIHSNPGTELRQPMPVPRQGPANLRRYSRKPHAQFFDLVYTGILPVCPHHRAVQRVRRSLRYWLYSLRVPRDHPNSKGWTPNSRNTSVVDTVRGT